MAECRTRRNLDFVDKPAHHIVEKSNLITSIPGRSQDKEIRQPPQGLGSPRDILVPNRIFKFVDQTSWQSHGARAPDNDLPLVEQIYSGCRSSNICDSPVVAVARFVQIKDP